MVNQSTGSGSLIADVAEFITEEDGTTVAFENDIDDVSGEKNPDPYNDEDGTGVLERRMDAVFVFTGHLLSSSTSEEMSGITSTNDDADDENAIDNDENDPMDDADSEASAMNEKATQGAYATDIHPYENWIVSAGCDDAAYMWDPSNGECLIECRNHTDSVIACQFSHDGQYLATAGMDGKVCVYEASQSKLLFEFNELHEVTALCWHPRGPVLVAGTVDGTLWMWSMPQGKVMHVICTTQSSVTCLNFCPNGKFLLSGNQNSLFTLHDPKTGTVVWTLSKEDKRWHQGAVTCFRVVNEVVVCGGEGGGLLLLQLASGKLIGSLGGHSESIESLDFCPSLSLIISGSMDGHMNIWDLATFRLRLSCSHPDGITQIKVHPSTLLVSTGCVDGIVRTWDCRSGVLVREWHGHESAILALSVSLDGETIVSSGDDGLVMVFHQSLLSA